LKKILQAPEVFDTNPYDFFKADVYAFGLVMWQIFSGELKIFPEFSDLKLFIRAIQRDHRPLIPSDS
jgi:hypothetical protein